MDQAQSEFSSVSDTTSTTTSAQSDVSSSSQISTPTTPVPQVQEKLVPQSKVDEIVRHSNASVAQKTREKVLAEIQTQQQQPPQTNYQTGYAPPPDQVSDQVKQEIYKLQQQAYFNQVSTDFASRVEAVKDQYTDFDQVVSDFPFASYPHAVLSSMNFENTGHIMYELAANPLKIEAIESLAKKDAENARNGIKSNLVGRELSKISEAIKVNQSAKTEKTPNSPLSQIKSSQTSADNGDLSVKDFRAYFRNNKR